MFFFSVSPFEVTALPCVGDVFVTLGPSVDLPLESVTPDCDWFFTPLVDLLAEVSLLIAPPVEPLLMLEPLLVLEPLLMLELSELMLEPPMLPELLLLIPVLSEDGATDPPTAVVSVMPDLSVLLLHAATATRVAKIAMRFMKSLRRNNESVSAARRLCASMHSCVLHPVSRQ